jgi:ankyrin repeat protein
MLSSCALFQSENITNEVNVRSVLDANGLKPFIEKGDRRAIRDWLRKGNDPDTEIPDARFETPTLTDYAAFAGNIEILDLFIRYGAKINPVLNDDNRIYSPLMAAVLGNRINTVNYLLKSGAFVNAQDFRGFTPLMLACERPRTGIDWVPGDPTRKDRIVRLSTDEWKAFYAERKRKEKREERGAKKIIRALLSRGADPWLTNSTGWNAFDITHRNTNLLQVLTRESIRRYPNGPLSSGTVDWEFWDGIERGQ